MRDFLLFAIVFGLLPFVFKRPALGVMMYTWISLMNPHRLTYGAAYEFPFAALIAVTTLISLLASKQEKKIPITPLTVVLLLFVIWMSLTTLSALEPERAWNEWNRVMKTMTLFGIAVVAIKDKEEIQGFAWTIAFSLGFYGLKGGAFTILSGGSSHVYGPEGSYINDNNALALALVTALPIIWYAQLSAKYKLVRFAWLGITILTVAAALGSYSRGALVGGGCMFIFLWIKSRQKIRTGLVILLLVPLVYSIMPEQWFDRMGSINDYKQDDSALGRINAWGYAFNVAKQNLMGGGLDCFTPRMFVVYAPDPNNFHAAHSIYFQVLGEHGFLGLALFLTFMFLTWRTGARVLKYCKGREDLKWAADLAAMGQVSVIGYAIGGAFLTLAYYDLYYDIIAILLLLEKVVIPKKSPIQYPNSTETPLDSPASSERP